VEVFGWVGSFILGIGFYSLTKMRSTRAFPARLGWVAWSLWTSGVALRWIGGVTGWEWRQILPASGLPELAGFLVFFFVVQRHRPSRGESAKGIWMILVMLATFVFFSPSS
jgi:uncharacterized protein involved in response to NO